MNDAWQDALYYATLAVQGDSTMTAQAMRAVERLSTDEHVLRHPTLSHDLALLTALLDNLGRQTASQALLQHVVSRLAWDTDGLNLDITSRNQLAVTLADRGYLAAAATVLSSALQFDPDQTDPDHGVAAARTLANLAALKMRLRDVEGADRTAQQAQQALEGPAVAEHSEDEPEVRLLVMSVLTETARRQGRHEDADRLLDDLERAVRRLVALLGGEHPQSLSALVALATAEFESARAAGDRGRMQRAAHVLAVASQKAAATVGAHHPQSVAALLSLAAVEGETAHDARDDRGIDDVRALFTEAAGRWSVMRRGADHAPRAPIPAPEPSERRETHLRRPTPEPRAPWETGLGRTTPPHLAVRSIAVDRAPGRGDEGTEALHFSVLGPVRAWRNTEPLSIGSPQQRALLAALLLRGRRAATAAELIDALWGEEPPSQALAAIRTYVSRLRKALTPGVLLNQSGGYALRAGAGSVDLADAQRLVGDAEKLRSAGERVRARDMLNKALALWDGESLAGTPGPYAKAQRVRLEEWRLQLCETRLALDLELGRHAEAVSELIALTTAHPLRGRLRELLTLALYRSGREAEALAVYADTRRLLANDL